MTNVCIDLDLYNLCNVTILVNKKYMYDSQTEKLEVQNKLLHSSQVNSKVKFNGLKFRLGVQLLYLKTKQNH